MPLRAGRGATPQMALSARCICAKTVVAPNVIAPKPASVGSRPLCSMRLFSTAVWTAAAAPAPIAASSRSAISPCAALSPSTRPTMLTATITTGATEKTVKKASAAACTNTCASSQTRKVAFATPIQYCSQVVINTGPPGSRCPSLSPRHPAEASSACLRVGCAFRCAASGRPLCATTPPSTEPDCAKIDDLAPPPSTWSLR